MTQEYPAPTFTEHTSIDPTLSDSFPTAPTLTPEHAAALRAELTEYTTANLVEAFGETAYSAYQAEQPTLLKIATVGNTKLAVLARLFLLNEKVEADALEKILCHTTAAELEAANLITSQNSHYQATVKLEPHALEFNDTHYNWWIASDFPATITGRPLHPHHVLGIGGATRTLLQATPRDRVERALDLGTGCGIIAMYAALHAKEVVATDISQRALKITQFNADLNQITLTLKHGSLFDPVDGDFDLIMSNPPFVITPDSLRAGGTLEYRDGGQAGDKLVGEVLEGAAQRLRPGGTVIMLGNWEITDLQKPEEHPQQWLNNQPVSAWIVERETLAPHQYVEMWLRDNAPAWMRSKTAYETDYASWVADFHARKVAAIALGILILKRPLADAEIETAEVIGADTPTDAEKSVQSNAVKLFEYSRISTTTSATGPYLKEVIQELTDNRLEINHTDYFMRSEDVREERHYQPGEPDPQIIIATQGSGFGQRIQLNTHTAAALGACDGELNIGQIVSAISVLTGVEKQQVENAVYGQIPQLILAGMLTRVK